MLGREPGSHPRDRSGCFDSIGIAARRTQSIALCDSPAHVVGRGAHDKKDSLENHRVL